MNSYVYEFNYIYIYNIYIYMDSFMNPYELKIDVIISYEYEILFLALWISGIGISWKRAKVSIMA